MCEICIRDHDRRYDRQARTNGALAADVTLIDDGSVVLLCLASLTARQWAEDNIGEGNGYQPYWPDRVVCERRYVLPILEGMQNDALDVDVSGSRFAMVGNG